MQILQKNIEKVGFGLGNENNKRKENVGRYQRGEGMLIAYGLKEEISEIRITQSGKG